MSERIYLDNLNSMKERYASIVDYLERPGQERNPIPEEGYLTAGVQDVSGKTVMFADKNGQMFQFESMYDDKDLTDIWFKTLGTDWNLDTKLFIYGLGNGMYARKYLESTREDCSIIIHEPSEKMLITALKNYDLTWLFENKRVKFVFWPLYAKNDDMKLYYVQLIDYKDISSIKVSFYTNYPRVFESDCQEYINGINGAKDYVLANQVVHNRFGDDYNRNTFNNLKYIPDSLSYEDLINKMPEDVTAIVVTAGPSLDKNISDLKAAKGKCLMIATDTALRPLALAGIQPDLTAIVDGKKDARYLSEESSRRVPLFCSPKSGDTFMNLHEGVKFFTNDSCDHIKAFMDKEGCMFTSLATGGSITNCCFGLAVGLGCKKIILVGLDLAYTGDKTHSTVTVRGEKKTAVEDLEHAYMDIDINGDPIRTSAEFRTYKQLLENEIRIHPELSVIDATEGGIRIEGTDLMTLKEAIRSECTRDFDFDSVLAGVDRLLSEEQVARFTDYITMIPDQLKELNKQINIALADYINMKKLVGLNNYRTSHFKKIYKESQDISKKIENSPVIEYVHIQLQGRSSEMLDKVNVLEEDERSELITVCNIGEKYLHDMLDALSELEPYVNTMKSYLR